MGRRPFVGRFAEELHITTIRAAPIAGQSWQTCGGVAAVGGFGRPGFEISICCSVVEAVEDGAAIVRSRGLRRAKTHYSSRRKGFAADFVVGSSWTSTAAIVVLGLKPNLARIGWAHDFGGLEHELS